MIGPASTADAILAYLNTLRSEDAIAGMARFGIATGTAVGISNPDLRRLARLVRRDHDRALLLWASDVREARLLAIYTEEPARLTIGQARQWADDFNSWEIVDTAADLFAEAPFWAELIAGFASDEREFVRRTAFAMIAGAAVHRKSEPDSVLTGYLPLIETHSGDPRNFVRKAVNWALRNIGKRNRTCHAPALAMAQTLAASTDKTARWIGKDAVRELTSDRILAKLKG